MLPFPLVVINRLNKTVPAVSIYCKFSLFLKDPFSGLFRGRDSCCCFCEELVKLLPVHRYSGDIFFSYSCPSGVLGSDGKHNIA